MTLVLKSNRNGNSNNILFIDASKDFIKGKNQNELSDEHIKKIVDTYINRADVDKYAHVAAIEEIIANDYNINIPRYVDTNEDEAEIDINEVIKSINDIDKEIADTSAVLKSSFKELGIPFPDCF